MQDKGVGRMVQDGLETRNRSFFQGNRDHSDSIESRAESMRGTTLSALKNRHLSLGPHLIYFSDSVPCELVL